jgi:hypothetical protein
MASFQEISHIKLVSALVSSTGQVTLSAHCNFYCSANNIIKWTLSPAGEILRSREDMRAAPLGTTCALSCARAHTKTETRDLLRRLTTHIPPKACSSSYDSWVQTIVTNTHSRPRRVLHITGDYRNTALMCGNLVLWVCHKLYTTGHWRWRWMGQSWSHGGARNETAHKRSRIIYTAWRKATYGEMKKLRRALQTKH